MWRHGWRLTTPTRLAAITTTATATTTAAAAAAAACDNLLRGGECTQSSRGGGRSGGGALCGMRGGVGGTLRMRGHHPLRLHGTRVRLVSGGGGGDAMKTQGVWWWWQRREGGGGGGGGGCPYMPTATSHGSGDGKCHQRGATTRGANVNACGRIHAHARADGRDDMCLVWCDDADGVAWGPSTSQSRARGDINVDLQHTSDRGAWGEG